MGEDLPPNSVFLPEEQQDTQPQPEDALGGTAVEPAAENEHAIDHSDKADDNRWDNDKARAIADAVLEEDKHTGSSGVMTDLEKQGQRIKNYKEAKDSEVKPNPHADFFANQEISMRGEQVSQKFNKAAEPYEELYESDPERFATMPTREFMHIGDLLKRTKHDLEILNEREKPLRELAYTLDSARSINAMSGERLVAIDMKPEADDKLADLILESLGQQPEDKEAIKAALGKLREGDKSAEDLQVAQARLIADYFRQAQGRKVGYAERLYKMFTNHHLPDSVRELLYPAPPEVPASFIGRPMTHTAEEQ